MREVWWTVLATHKNPEYFKEPEKFDPSRFEGSGPAPYIFIPFGGGPRICPGRDFAYLEILVFLHNVVQEFKWELVWSMFRGDMFESVPSGDAIIVKFPILKGKYFYDAHTIKDFSDWVLHNSGDELCVKILRNCCKALPDSGKVIVVEFVLQYDDGINETGSLPAISSEVFQRQDDFWAVWRSMYVGFSSSRMEGVGA
ncbi:hypothetical protein ACLOJK_009581 [Asimina triloba]